MPRAPPAGYVPRAPPAGYSAPAPAPAHAAPGRAAPAPAPARVASAAARAAPAAAKRQKGQTAPSGKRQKKAPALPTPKGKVEGIKPGPAVRPSEVTTAITIKGAQLAWAILRGFKRVENRAFTMRAGWYAVHTGKAESVIESQRSLLEGVASLPSEETLPHSVIVGAIEISHALRMPQCQHEPWASGEIVNVIVRYCNMSTPVAHSGALSTWLIADEAIAQVQAQLSTSMVCENDISHLPRHISIGGEGEGEGDSGSMDVAGFDFCAPLCSPLLVAVFREAERSFVGRQVFAAGISTFLHFPEADAQKIHAAISSASPATDWIHATGEEGNGKAFSDKAFVMTDNETRFFHVWNVAFPTAQVQFDGRMRPGRRACADGVFAHTRVDLLEQLLNRQFGQLEALLDVKAYALSKVAQTRTNVANMVWHSDQDKRDVANKANAVCYFILPPDPAAESDAAESGLNCIMVFGGPPAHLRELSARLEAMPVKIRPPQERPPVRSTEWIPVVQIPLPAELEATAQGLDVKSYAMWVRGGDLLVFDGSTAHGIYNFAPQRVLAFNASFVGLRAGARGDGAGGAGSGGAGSGGAGSARARDSGGAGSARARDSGGAGSGAGSGGFGGGGFGW